MRPIIKTYNHPRTRDERMHQKQTVGPNTRGKKAIRPLGLGRIVNCFYF